MRTSSDQMIIPGKNENLALLYAGPGIRCFDTFQDQQDSVESPAQRRIVEHDPLLPLTVRHGPVRPEGEHLSIDLEADAVLRAFQILHSQPEFGLLDSPFGLPAFDIVVNDETHGVLGPSSPFHQSQCKNSWAAMGGWPSILLMSLP